MLNIELLMISIAFMGVSLAIALFFRIRLSLAKHPTLAGHSRWSRRLARIAPFFSHDASSFFSCDGASDDVVERRKRGFSRLVESSYSLSSATLNASEEIERQVSDALFTRRYRVPFMFTDLVPEALTRTSLVVDTDRVRLKDLDGNWRYDLWGSYGVNVFGYDFYQRCMLEGRELNSGASVVLGPHHPSLLDNARRLAEISGLNETSFHMSGTEAVMQAVRLACYHTGRSKVVRFCGAYHGWWDGVQPGIGNQRANQDVLTLSEGSPRTLQVLEDRKDIACVLVNPMQLMHLNKDAPSDQTLVVGQRVNKPQPDAYRNWLHQLQAVCARQGIVFILDEVFTGFRLARGGAKEYFGVRPDLITYGKTLGGGLPVGVVCGTSELMRRFKPDRPADVCLARGTFNSHPEVMGAMNSFLRRIDSSDCSSIYEDSHATWDRRVVQLNEALVETDLPLRVVNFQSVLTVNYLNVACHNWLLQFYMRAEGLELGWVGTGRFIMSLGYTEDDWSEVCVRFLRASKAMAADGFWDAPKDLSKRKIQMDLAKRALLSKRRPPQVKPALTPCNVVETEIRAQESALIHRT